MQKLPAIRKSRAQFAISILFIALLVAMAAHGLSASSSQSGTFTVSDFSNTTCSATGSTATRHFTPSGIQANSNIDSTVAIQRAINVATSVGGGIVALPAGTFLINGHLILKHNVELTGVGPATVLKAGPNFLNSTGPEGGYPLVTTSGASQTTIANLTADQSGNILKANSRSASRLSAYLLDVRKSHNAVVENVYTRNPFTYSIAIVSTDDFCVSRCDTQVSTSGRYNSLDGIHVLDSHTGQVIGNRVDQRLGTDGDDGLVAHTITAPVYDVLYANNIVRGGNDGDGMQLAVGNYPIFDVVVRDNNFWGSPFGIRTGYWNSGPNGAVHNITISSNYIHNLVPGKAFPQGGDAIDIGDFGAVAPVTYITAVHNRICRAGIIKIVSGKGDFVAHNYTCP